MDFQRGKLRAVPVGRVGQVGQVGQGEIERRTSKDEEKAGQLLENRFARQTTKRAIRNAPEMASAIARYRTAPSGAG